MATALITGGTSGIGATFARRLAAKGHDIVLVARDRERLERMAHELRGMGRQVEILPADLSKRSDVAKVVKRLEDSKKPIDVLVNNAGFGMHTRLSDADSSGHDAAFEVMVRSVRELGAASARAMRARGTGRIINVSSTAGFIAMSSGYSSIKAWVTSFSEGLSNELHGTGVTVTALCPGWVHTEFHERAGISKGGIPGWLWLDADKLVRAALRDAERGRVISIPSVRYKVLMGILRHLPRSVVRSISRAISSSRTASSRSSTVTSVTEDERAEKERSMSAKAKRFTSRGRAAARFFAQRGLLVPVAWSTVSVEVHGATQLKKVGKAFIVIANHSSHLDAPLILGSLPMRMSRYLAAGAAADYFFDVWWRRGLTGLFFNAFPVDRSGVDPRGVSAKVLLQNGVPLLVFPEGTRAKDYRKLGHFKPGAAALAAATGVPCIPVALVGAGRAHPRGGKWPKPGRLKVGVVYGAPMYARDGEVPTEFMARVKAEIERMLAEHSPRILGTDSASADPEEGQRS